MIDILVQAVSMEQAIEAVDEAADEALARLEEGRTLPAISLLASLGPLVGIARIGYRAEGLLARTQAVIAEQDRQFALTLYPHPVLDRVLLGPRADIYVPGTCGYSVVELDLRDDRHAMEVRSAGEVTDIARHAARTLNVTGGLLSRRGQAPTAPIVGYHVEEALAPIAARLYLRRFAEHPD